MRLIGSPEPEQIGKYRLLAKIGQGAMGRVYRAHDPALNRYVAIKTIKSAGATDDLDRRFLREAQSAARLNHPNIVTIFDFGEDRGTLYMAMELLEGRDLKDVIKRHALPNLDEKLRVVAEICEGLAFAHAMEIVHRDLKPGNLHILPNGQVKIMDFGLARLGSSDMTKSGMILGTPNYMSPEQVRGERVDARSDIFSVGAVFYELLVGRKAFDAESMHSVLLQVLQEEPKPLPDVVPDVPASIAELIQRALKKDPAERYQNAGEMAEAVNDLRARLHAESPELLGLAVEAAAAAPGGDEPRTLMELDPSVARRRDPTVAGATALAPLLAPRLAPGQPATLSGKSPTHPPGRLTGPVSARRARAPLVAGAVFVVASGAAALAYWQFGGPVTPAPSLAPADLAKEQEGILKEALVDNQLELARLDFENKSYQGAIDRAQRVLSLDPQSVRATEIRDQSHAILAELEASAAQARGAFAKGDTEAASRALAKVLSIDPRHPVAAELTVQLNKFFRARAEAARQDALDSKAAADDGRATAQPEYAAAEQAAKEADAIFGREEYAVATQKYMEAHDTYEKARRSVEAAARTPLPRPGAASGDPAGLAEQRSVAPPVLPPAVTLPETVAPPASAAIPSVAPAVPGASAAHEAAIRQVLSDYARAIATKDLELFRKVKPSLSKDEVKRLQDAFKAIKSQDVGLSVDSLAIDGAEAVVRVSRQDTINGSRMKMVQQTFHLARAGDAWSIESIGQ